MTGPSATGCTAVGRCPRCLAEEGGDGIEGIPVSDFNANRIFDF